MPPRQAVVLVGGLGTRLGALTAATPKPLLPVAGRPFLAWIIGELRRQGVESILLLAGHMGAAIEALVQDSEDVSVLVEPAPLGTGGALRFAADRGSLDEVFFLLNGDSLFDINLWGLAAAHRDALATLALRPVKNCERFGSVVLDGPRIVKFSDRGAPGPGTINGGVGVLARALVDRIPPQGATSIETAIYPRLAEEGSLRGVVFKRPFLDIGIPEDFARSQDWIGGVVRRSAVIFDRDGVINKDVGYAHRPEQIEWTNGAVAAIRAVNDAGLLALVATNQAGVARGLYGEAEVLELHRWMNQELMRQGAHIDAFDYSPFHPEGVVEAYRRDSACRKPGPEMILRLLQRFEVAPEDAMLVGDRPTDVQAAEAAGVHGVLFDGDDLLPVVAKMISLLSPAANADD